MNSYTFLTLKQRSYLIRSTQTANFVKIIQDSQIQDWFFHLTNLSKDLRKRPLMKTISPAIDILVSSNLERHLWMHLGDNGVKAFLKSHTGWISEIWKNVQFNIHYTYTASTETNNTSAKSPGFQL